MRGIYCKVKYFFVMLTQKKPYILDRMQTIKRIQNNNMSVSRFGDGEFGLLWNQSIGFQKSDDEIKRRLIEVLDEGTNIENLLICIPSTLNSVKNLEDRPKKYWMNWILNNRHKLVPFMKKKYVYGDSLITRIYVPWRDKSKEKQIINNIRLTWNNKSIVIVEGEKTRFGVGNDLVSNAKSVKRILCPNENSFLCYKRILKSCINAHNEGIEMFILALGPTATILAYDLAKVGIQALDLGHIDLQYEYLIRDTTKRIAIPGKYNNELNEIVGKQEIENVMDKEYVNSIMTRIEIDKIWMD